MDISQIGNYVRLAIEVVGFFSVVATVTPTPVDDGVALVAKRVLDVLAMNIGKAKNAE